MPNCLHRMGYQKKLETARFIMLVIRCSQCHEFIKAETKAKQLTQVEKSNG